MVSRGFVVALWFVSKLVGGDYFCLSVMMGLIY